MADFPTARLACPARVHMIGVGGVGMSGLARLLQGLGCTVSGSDTAPNPLTDALSAAGVRIFPGHAREHVNGAVDWAVRTPAVDAENVELAALRGRHVPVYARGEVLAAYSRTRKTLAVAGAHGKTTTSAMLTHLLRAAGMQPGYAIGGETAFPGRVADTGEGPWFVCEADESDGTLTQYAPFVGVLTHVEWDHVERFPTEAALLQCYRRFVARCAHLVVWGADVLAMRVSNEHPQRTVLGRDVLWDTDPWDGEGQGLCVHFPEGTVRTRLPLPGAHQARNAVMAMTAARAAGCSPAAMDLQDFVSVGRRFSSEVVAGVRVLHDYAHHPTEVAALMDSVQSLGAARVVAAFQPHRYSRTRHLLQGFAEAFTSVDALHLLPVYAASEAKARGVDSDALAACFQAACPQTSVTLHTDRADLVGQVSKELRPGDLFLIVGAGDIVMVEGMIKHNLNNKAQAGTV